MLNTPQIDQSYHVEIEPTNGPLVIFDAALRDYSAEVEDGDVCATMKFDNGVAVYTGGSSDVKLIEAQRWAEMEIEASA